MEGSEMRVAIGGFAHETNTFHPLPTTLADFQGPAGVWLRGEAIVDTFAGTRSVIGGMLDAGREQGWTILPAFFADHPPITGTLTADAFQAIRGELAGSIRATHPDAALLFLHGACVATGEPDPEAEVLREVRQALGPHAPIVVVF